MTEANVYVWTTVGSVHLWNVIATLILSCMMLVQDIFAWVTWAL